MSLSKNQDQNHFSLSIRLDWSEMDLFGHINNVAYFKYIQAARVNIWERIGLAGRHEAQNIGPIRAETGCKFIRALHYPGAVKIKSQIEKIGNTSFTIAHIIYDTEGREAARARDAVVVYDFEKGEKVPVPEEDRQAMKKASA
jgi:acyl-CoA thioester hydrolase